MTQDYPARGQWGDPSVPSGASASPWARPADQGPPSQPPAEPDRLSGPRTDQPSPDPGPTPPLHPAAFDQVTPFDRAGPGPYEPGHPDPNQAGGTAGLALGYPEPGQAGETAGLALGYPELGHPEPGQAGGTAGLALGYPEPVHPGAGYPNQPYPNAGPAYPPYPAAGYPNQPYPSAGPPAPAYPATGYADPAYPPATAVYPGPAGPFDPSGAATVAPYVDPAWAYVPTPSPYYVPQPPAPLPNTLGLVGLIMSVVTVAGGVLTAFRFGGGSGSNYDPWNPTYSNDAAVGIAFAFTGLSLIGLASFVIGIVAAASKRGRGQGVGAIVLSVLGPLVFFLALGIAIESNL